MKFAVYDIEILKNLFTVCFYDFQSEKKKEFVLFDSKESLGELVLFLKRLKKHDYILVGFNSINFDSQLIELILANYENWLKDDYCSVEDIITQIYNRAQEIITVPDEEKFKILIPEWKLSIPQIDLFKQKHYDGKAKLGTSLKWIQFSMRYHTVEEMPIEHTATVSKEEIPLVLSYNWNDVLSTVEFFKKIKFETDLRADLSEKYNLRLINASEPRLAKLIFGKFLCEDMNIEMSSLRDMRTYRKYVKLKDVIFPYVKFETEKLQKILDAINEVTINFEEKNTFKYQFEYGGITTDIGLGGIHACCSPGVYTASEDWIIEDIDVVSFYPNLAIQNNVKPHHLGNSFSKIYNDIFQKRKSIPKKDPTNYVYKIILNSTYGLSKEVNSYLYDPFFTYSITINGQLSLLMLVEKLVQQIPGIKIYQENTDGVTIGYHPKYRELISEICKAWSSITNLETEHAFYSKMVIRDVNNYIGVKNGFDWNEYQEYVAKGKRKDYDKLKHKGIFELDLDYHKNPSFIIISMAAEAHFLGDLDYRDFIKNHTDIYDFLGAVKRKKTFKLNLYTFENGVTKAEEQQKVTRYYISTKGGTLVKDFTDGRKASKVGIESGWKVSTLNKVEDTNALNYPIDYTYYIKEAEKLIDSVEPNTKQLTIF
jgi:hypothetical protein